MRPHFGRPGQYAWAEEMALRLMLCCYNTIPQLGDIEMWGFLLCTLSWVFILLWESSQRNDFFWGILRLHPSRSRARGEIIHATSTNQAVKVGFARVKALLSSFQHQQSVLLQDKEPKDGQEKFILECHHLTGFYAGHNFMNCWKESMSLQRR